VSEPLVEIKHLSKHLALSDINAVIPKGQIVGLVGPDGAGKTTLIRLIAGLLLPTKGQITVAGHDTVTDVEAIRLISGYMPQKFGLYEDLSVIQNMDLFADLRGVEGKDRNETFKKLFQFTNLEPFKDRLARNLSGGMKQKLGLACALIKKPVLLLLDEPSVGVDPISRRELWKMVHALVEEGISVVWSTAYLDEAQQCNTVILLNEGKVLYSGDPKGLTQRVEGRVFKIVDISGDRRALLFKVLENKDVLDATIQGADLRFVTRGKVAPFPAVPATPRFEDGFIDILGGGPGGKSELGNRAPILKNHAGPVIEARGLTKQFGTFIAANDINLTVNKGEVFGLLGPNGAGKSTIFKMLCGLLKPTRGTALVNGIDLLVSSSQARSHIGYMAQKFSLYGDLSVEQNLSFFAGIYAAGGAVDEMIETFGLQPYLNTTAEQLPLGFKQRLALACANMHHPEILFLDEPTSGVDPITRREFWNHINGLVQKGVTVMITTHFMDEAEYCDRIALIYQGKIIAMSTSQGLKEKVKSPQLPNPTLEDAFIHMIEAYA
jgi:ABC-2 type transport system ATP-binding protein